MSDTNNKVKILKDKLLSLWNNKLNSKNSGKENSQQNNIEN